MSEPQGQNRRRAASPSSPAGRAASAKALRAPLPRPAGGSSPAGIGEDEIAAFAPDPMIEPQRARRDRRRLRRGARRALPADRRAGQLRRHARPPGRRIRDREFPEGARREPRRHDAHVHGGKAEARARRRARSSTPRRCIPSSARRTRRPTPRRRAASRSSRNRSPSPGRRDGIRVNAIAPGWIDTPLTAPAVADVPRSAAIVARTPLGALGKAGRRRRRRALPAVRRGALRHRHGASGRRRLSDHLKGRDG